jgi:hypothetical protein
MGQALGPLQHIPTPHKWAQGRLQAGTLAEIIKEESINLGV